MTPHPLPLSPTAGRGGTYPCKYLQMSHVAELSVTPSPRRWGEGQGVRGLTDSGEGKIPPTNPLTQHRRRQIAIQLAFAVRDNQCRQAVAD